MQIADKQVSGGVSSKRLQIASWGAMLGGFMYLTNWLMQTYLDMNLGEDSILHDTTHPAFYINILTLFLAMLGFLIGLFTLHKMVKATGSGIMWQIGFFISAITQFIFSLTLLQGIAQVLGLDAISEALITVIGIGSLGIFLGALPIGIFMISRKIIPKTSSILFLLTIPAVVVYFITYSMGIPLLGGFLVGATYGGAWIIVGTYFKKLKN